MMSESSSASSNPKPSAPTLWNGDILQGALGFSYLSVSMELFFGLISDILGYRRMRNLAGALLLVAPAVFMGRAPVGRKHVTGEVTHVSG